MQAYTQSLSSVSVVGFFLCCVLELFYFRGSRVVVVVVVVALLIALIATEKDQPDPFSFSR